MPKRLPAPSTTVVVVTNVRTIYKYPVEVDDEFTIGLPEGARVLSVDTQHGEPVMWALVDPTAPTTNRTFRVIGTGHPIEDAAELAFVGTFQMRGGSLIFHLFEKSPAEALGLQA
jgi:hypothetical protein